LAVNIMRNLSRSLMLLALFCLGALSPNTFAQVCPCTIWTTTTTPGAVDSGDGNAGEYGFRFRSDVSGFITGIRFYKSAANTGTHTGHLWSNTGNLLASTTFAGETTSGWQQANFSTPVPIVAGTTYVASYYTPTGHYSFDTSFFTNAVDNPPLHALADGVDGANGVFAYAGNSIFPRSTFQSSNYWVEVVFDTAIATPPPSITSVSPADGASNISPATAVTAAFSQAMDPTTFDNNTFQLLDPSNNAVGATVTYNGSTSTATLQPFVPLLASTTYTAVVRGGTVDPRVKNQSGVAMTSSVSWSFTTANPPGSCPCSIWSSGATPGVVDGGDSSSGEFGVRFRSDISGYITGIRFYKSATNTGAHTAHLWTNTGTLLASAAFTGESNSGWQQANFSAPVPIVAGTTYVASYFTATGHYSFNSNFFTAAIDNPPLHALADGLDGANGVFSLSGSSAFPASTFNSSNYWVDVVFDTTNTVPPSVTSFSPPNGATTVSPSTAVTATFNKAMDSTTINAGTFELLDPANNVLSATVAYDSSTLTATLQPSTPLAFLTTYTAIVRGGTVDPRVKDASGNSLAANVTWTFTTAAAPPPLGTCPCSIWSPTTTPAVIDSGDSNSFELGVRFRSDVNGYITGIRFYKATANGTPHSGHLWSNSGTLLGTTAFTGESSSGWQQANFSAPVPILAGTTYVASYNAPFGHYSFGSGFFTSAVDNPPLHALKDGIDGPNGVFTTANIFPTSTFNSSNYWVDVVFVPNNSTAPPSVTSTSPADGAAGVSLTATPSATFSVAMDGTSLNSSTVLLMDSSNNPVSGTVSYGSSTTTVTFQPTSSLKLGTTYTATVKGVVKDAFGNAMGQDFVWSFATVGTPPSSGPGGPILVISNTTNPFTRYFDEMLRAEGMNEFTIADISTVTSTTLTSYDIAILGDMPLTSGQVSMFTTWVNGGGRLIAMHPDKQLAGLLGLTSTSGTLADKYLLVNTASGPGVGIVNQTVQYHGPADLYNLNGATRIATLYSDSITSTVFPAVTLFNSGAGQAAAFAYDLARSVVYTRQGNPAWSGQERDGVGPIRSDDLYFGDASFDPQPDYVDLNKVAIPQADEQQRLLVNLILQMNLAKKPLPRFWYLPSGLKAVVVMTGDDHGSPGMTAARFDQYIADSTPGCSVPDWQCIRATSYTYTDTTLTDAQAASYSAQGFEMGLHVVANPNDPLSNWTSPSALDGAYTSELANWMAKYTSQPAPKTSRTHAIAWTDYDTQPQVELSHGIRLDTNYYYWPDSWMQNVPGLFTGSGFPMRFADRNGNTIDVYQATTQIPDEDSWTYPDVINTLLDNAQGPLGYYGVFTTNMHTDLLSAGSDAIVAAAQARSVPVISSLQMLTWLDGRNSSSFQSLVWSSNTLSFTIAVGTGARNLRAMVPFNSQAGSLTSITLNGSSISFTLQTIKGVQYAVFNASAGSYQAIYNTVGPTFTVSGTISGSGGNAATVTLGGAASATTTASATGTYSFTGLPNGSYTVTPSKSGFSFTPPSQNVTVSGANVTGVNFSSTAQTFSIAGTISGSGGNAATVTLGGTAGATTTASATGAYTFTGLANGSYTVTPSKSGFSFTPASQNVTVSGANVTSVDFSSTAQTFSIAGTISGSGGNAATVTLGGTASATTTASATGAYAFTGLADGSYTVTPSKSGFSFTPPSQNVTVSGANVTGVNFSSTAQTFSIAGTISGSGGNAATVTLGGTAGATTTASATGAYTFTGLANGSYTVTPSKSGFSFTPASQNVTVSGANVTGVNFSSTAQTFSIAGTISGSGGNAATVTLGGSASATTTASATGAYTFTGLVNGSYTVTPSKSGFSFTPASQNVIINGANLAAVNFASAAVTLASVALQPATVTGGASSTGTATLSTAAPAGGAVVALQSSNSSVAQLPPSVTIPAGSTSATFTIGTAPVPANTSVIISGTLGVARTATLTVNAAVLSSVTRTPRSVVGGNSSSGTATLTGAAPAGGALVTLSSSNTGVGQVPASVTIPAGATSASFTITTSGVAAQTLVTITGVYVTSRNTSLTVNPASLISLTLNPSIVVGGSSSTGTLALDGAAPPSGAVVSLGSSRPAAAQVPASATIPFGATSITFTVTTSPVHGTSSRISGVYRGTTRRSTITIQ
jgi:uncharacterized protein DUF4082/Big-like domain-containing protein